MIHRITTKIRNYKHQLWPIQNTKHGAATTYNRAQHYNTEQLN